jgi:hypothetical protein
VLKPGGVAAFKQNESAKSAIQASLTPFGAGCACCEFKGCGKFFKRLLPLLPFL